MFPFTSTLWDSVISDGVNKCFKVSLKKNMFHFKKVLEGNTGVKQFITGHGQAQRKRSYYI